MADITRHICGISGGKDSSALAVHLRNKVPALEYFFCDTGAELPETYEYLTRLEVILGKPITRLNARRGFDHWFEVFRGTLPSPQMRWCTKNLKIKPIEAWIGDAYCDLVRRDPLRRVEPQGLHFHQAQHPVGVSVHRRWNRSRRRDADSRRRRDWPAGLLRLENDGPVATSASTSVRPSGSALPRRHPELFDRAVAIERKVLRDAGVDGDADFGRRAMRGRQYTWSAGETLPALLARREEILQRHVAAMSRAGGTRANVPLMEVLADALDEDDDTSPCTVCAP